MNNNPDNRKSKRVLMDFVLEVSASDIEGNEYIDNAVLIDISGGGAKFISRRTTRYFLGQQLEIIIYLPGTSDVRAYLEGTATVVRTYSHKDQDGIEGEEIGIAVSFDDPLRMGGK